MNPQSARPSREQARDEQLPRPPGGPGGREPRPSSPSLAAALLAAACSSGSPSSAGSGGSPNAGGSANSSSGLAYTRCVRSHGVPDFPDPDSSGQLPKVSCVSALRGVSDSRAKAATGACARPEPRRAGKPHSTAQEQQDYLRSAACMRSHGITDFPDPTFPGGRVNLSDPRQHRYHVQAVQPAAQTCTRLIPARLPLQHGLRWAWGRWLDQRQVALRERAVSRRREAGPQAEALPAAEAGIARPRPLGGPGHRGRGGGRGGGRRGGRGCFPRPPRPGPGRGRPRRRRRW